MVRFRRRPEAGAPTLWQRAENSKLFTSQTLPAGTRWAFLLACSRCGRTIRCLMSHSRQRDKLSSMERRKSFAQENFGLISWLPSIFTFTFSRLEWETNTDDRWTRGRSNNFPQKPRALSRSITWSFFAQATTAHDRCESFSCFLLLIVHTHAKLIDVVARLLTFIGCIFFLSPRYVLPNGKQFIIFSATSSLGGDTNGWNLSYHLAN